MSRSLFFSHLLPAAASSAIAGVVNYSFLERSFRGAGIGALAGLVYSATHDILENRNNSNSFLTHSVAILSSAILTYGVSAAAAAAGLIAKPTLAAFGALVSTAIIINAVTRLIFRPRKQESERVEPLQKTAPEPQPSSPLKIEEQAETEPKKHLPEPTPLPPPTKPTGMPATATPKAPPVAVLVPSSGAEPPAKSLEKPKITEETPPPPPSQKPEPKAPPETAPNPPSQAAAEVKSTIKEFLDSQEYKNCKDWLEDFKKIEDNKWIHKSAQTGRYVITAKSASYIPGAQLAASYFNNHTTEQLALHLENSKTIFDRNLTGLIELYTNSQDKTIVLAEIRRISQSIKEALKPLAKLKKTYRSDQKVESAVANLITLLEKKQWVLLTKIPS